MTADDPRRAASDYPRRLLIDPAGRAWDVFEAPLPYDRRGGKSLVFAANDIMRRVRTYPANWFELPDPALLELSNNK
jgi:hypothetical protein